MIYIFQSFSYICSLPALLCKGCAEACRQCNCKLCSQACKAISDTCKGFTQRPLCAYVVIVFALCGVEIYFSYDGYSTLGCSAASTADANAGTCPFCDTANTFNGTTTAFVLMAFGVLNILFAPYMMHKVWVNVLEAVDANPDRLETDKRGQRFIPKFAVQDAFKYVFMQDFVVLFFFFISLGHVYIAWTGYNADSGLQECREIAGAETLSQACLFGILSFVITLLFTFTYYCCACCSKSVVLSADVAESMDLPGTEGAGEPMYPVASAPPYA